MFHGVIVLTVGLTFSVPFAILAQQHTIQIAAKTAAEQDADNDVNKFLWFGAGVGTCCIGGTIGYLAGGTVSSLLMPTPMNASVPDDLTRSVMGWSTIVGGLIPLIGIYNYQGAPPPERLLGKSAKYVEFYTDAYKTKTRSLRTKWAAIGTAAAVIGLGFYANTQ